MKTLKIYSAKGTEAIQEKLYNGTQSVNFTGIYRIKYLDCADQKVRVLIQRDSYDSQSYAKIECWNGTNGWKHITSLNFKDTKTQSIFYQTKAQNLTGYDTDKIGTDIKELIELAKLIIF